MCLLKHKVYWRRHWCSHWKIHCRRTRFVSSLCFVTPKINTTSLHPAPFFSVAQCSYDLGYARLSGHKPLVISEFRCRWQQEEVITWCIWDTRKKKSDFVNCVATWNVRGCNHHQQERHVRSILRFVSLVSIHAHTVRYQKSFSWRKPVTVYYAHRW